MEDYRATGALRCVPLFLALKAQALRLAGQTSEALQAITEAEATGRKIEANVWRPTCPASRCRFSPISVRRRRPN